MKTTTLFLCAAAVAMVAMTSCGKEEETDTVAPAITLVGAAEIDVTLNQSYTDPGYSAQDDTDGDLTDQVEVNGTVDVNQTGVYELSYSVSDAAGNETTLSRSVTVVNDADFLGGMYSVSTNCASSSWDNDDFMSFITVSETNNNAFTISELRFDLSTTVQSVDAMLDGQSIDVPNQTVDGEMVEGTGEVISADEFEITLSTGNSCLNDFTRQ
ncbi:DUF5011 domain-containing protein [Sanyastnella coralliicola]|uniref:DUF5011 domain-containing protein n=1 Tax=Sanyastnella coralliicola TaxID=3069118 RepID=UPI0027BA932F|nr:DUF5011 domain-containing protein [Longitalea sp. SCSIO 12813]